MTIITDYIIVTLIVKNQPSFCDMKDVFVYPVRLTMNMMISLTDEIKLLWICSFSCDFNYIAHKRKQETDSSLLQQQMELLTVLKRLQIAIVGRLLKVIMFRSCKISLTNAQSRNDAQLNPFDCKKPLPEGHVFRARVQTGCPSYQSLDQLPNSDAS